MKNPRRTGFHVAARSALAVLLMTMLVAMSGCSSVAVFLGWRIRLDSLPVTAVSASLVDARKGAAINALAPGQSAQLVIVATTQDGKQYPTVGAGKGKVAFDNYTITVTTVETTKKGKISLAEDPRASEGKVAHVHVVPTAHPDLVADLDIPIRYDVPFVADFSGADGARGLDGWSGSDGTAGSDGTPGTVDPTTGFQGPQGPGSPGSDGGRGQDGADGQNGAPGAALHVWVRLLSDASPRLLQIKVDGGRRPSFYLIDPNGGTLKVLDNGGAGGGGGTGGRGGRGGTGGSGNPPGASGLDGQSGWDGHPGSDGAAGTLAISVDPAAQPFMSCITWVNHTGSGRDGPPATVNVESVGPLW